MNNHGIYITLILSLFSLSAFSASKVSDCQSRPDFVSGWRSSSLRSIDALPKMIFVGRKADYYVENKKENLKIWGQQSFVRAESKIICASAPVTMENNLGFSMYAPTLLDLTRSDNSGDSYWQFHLMPAPKQFGIWKQKSRLFSKAKDLETALSRIGAQIQIYQVTHNEYEMVLTRESEQSFEMLSVYFDAVSDIH
jgi:hypothetical protein